jgi:hypothetical protein
MNWPFFNIDLGFRLGWLGSWRRISIVSVQFRMRARFNLRHDRSVSSGRRFHRVLGVGLRYRVVRHTLGPTCRAMRVQRRRSIRLLSLTRNLGVLVFMLGLARGAAGLLHIRTNHCHNSVVGHAAFTRTIIVQNVTKPKLALLHQTLPKEPLAGEKLRKALPY